MKFRYLPAWALLLFSLGNTGCAIWKKTPNQSHLQELVELMSGSFTSGIQAASDTNYYDITLQMYPIWESQANDTVWLYVEQAVSAMASRPYRQRVYKVFFSGNNQYQSMVFELPNPKEYIGKWQEPAFFKKLSPEELISRQGCTVFLTRLGSGVYKGSTSKNDCASNLRGATYATSEVEIVRGRVTSWDRGFDDSGQQVWGAELGPYIFLKEGD